MSEPNVAKELTELCHLWRHEGLSPLSYIKGWAELLLAGTFGELTPEQRDAVEIIFQNSGRATDVWQVAGDYLALQYESEGLLWEEVSLYEVIKRTKLHLVESGATPELRLELPQDLPPIKSNKDKLPRAIAYLIDPFPGKQVETFYPPRIIVHPHPDQVVLQIYTCANIQTYNPQAAINPFPPGTRLAVSQLIVQQHGGDIQVHLQKDGTVFEFSLPVWQQ